MHVVEHLKSLVLKRRLRASSTVLLFGVLLTACGGTAPSSTPSQQQVELRLGYFPNLTHATALIGIKQSILADALRPEASLTTKTFNAGPDAVTALLSNSVDASYIGPNPAVNAFIKSHGQAIRIISGATSGGASLVVRPSINSPADLKGKTLASPQLGNTQDVALRWWLKQKGLKTTTEGGGDVSIHPQDNAQTLQTFRAGQIDGAWVPEPWATRLVLEGGGKRLVDERDVWPGGQFSTTVLAVRTDFLRNHPTAVRRLLDGQVEAGEYINTHPTEAQRLANESIAAVTGKSLAEQAVTQAWGQLTFTDDPIARSLQDSAQHAHEVGLLETVNLKGIFDLSLLNEARRARGKAGIPGL